MLIKYLPGGQGGGGGYSFNPSAGYTGTLTDGLVGWWSLDEESGTRADSLEANDLSDNNTVGYAAGKLGNAASFVQDNNEALSKEGDFTGDFSAGTSASLWVTPTPAYEGTFCTLGTGSFWASTNFALWKGTGIRLYIHGTTGGDIDTNSALTVGTTYHVVGTLNKATRVICIYVNGGAPTTATYTGDPSVANSTAFWISEAAGAGWSGLIDEVGLWNRALTSDEVAELYNSGDGFFYPFT